MPPWKGQTSRGRWPSRHLLHQDPVEMACFFTATNAIAATLLSRAVHNAKGQRTVMYAGRDTSVSIAARRLMVSHTSPASRFDDISLQAMQLLSHNICLKGVLPECSAARLLQSRGQRYHRGQSQARRRRQTQAPNALMASTWSPQMMMAQASRLSMTARTSAALRRTRPARRHAPGIKLIPAILALRSGGTKCGVAPSQATARECGLLYPACTKLKWITSSSHQGK